MRRFIRIRRREHHLNLTCENPAGLPGGIFSINPRMSYFSFSVPSAGDAGLAFFSWFSLTFDPGVGVLAPAAPIPVVPGRAFVVPRAGGVKMPSPEGRCLEGG